MACEAEAASSTKKTRKTVIEETKRGVHAAWLTSWLTLVNSLY
jgi:hypothetical protein